MKRVDISVVLILAGVASILYSAIDTSSLALLGGIFLILVGFYARGGMGRP